jgi:hypothetical protein
VSSGEPRRWVVSTDHAATVHRYDEVWAEPDHAARVAVLSEIWTEDGAYVDPDVPNGVRGPWRSLS